MRQHWPLAVVAVVSFLLGAGAGIGVATAVRPWQPPPDIHAQPYIVHHQPPTSPRQP